MKNGFLKIWGVPVLMAILSMVGLLSALIGDGPWDGLSWIALGIPVIVICWFFARRGKIAK
jgi:hypothetical protein